jgi:hypothetical protein
MEKEKEKKKMGCCGMVVLALLVLAVGAAVMVGRGIDGAREVLEGRGDAPKGCDILAGRLDYLGKLEDVAWHAVDNYDVYMAYKGNDIPLDFKAVANAAAKAGSDALVEAGHGITLCAVWVVPEEAKPGDIGTVYYSVSARKGRIEKKD